MRNEFLNGFPDRIEPRNQHLFATAIPSRSPEFKTHRSEGLANSAIGQRNWYEKWAKYKFEEGVWVKVAEYYPPETCRCGRFFREAVSNTSNIYSRALYRGDPKDERPRWLQQPICNICYTEADEARRTEATRKKELAELDRLTLKYGK